MAIILSKDMIYSTMEGIVPSRCRLTTRHLGATSFKLRLYQICKSHVAASMHHDTWGLIEDPTHHIIMSRPLGATNCSCQTIQGTKLFIHYIEGSTAQLVKQKALNLVDVNSSPMMGVTSYDVLFKTSIYKVLAQYYLIEPALGATRCCSSLYDHINKVPDHYYIMTRPLGATLVEVF